MRFYLGTHQVDWLHRVGFDLFVSRRRLCARKSFRRATCGWALDSGGFTELNLHGRWETGVSQYVDEVSRWTEAIGGMRWAAIQDWMCEPFVLSRTGLSISEHQARTVQSLIDLRSAAPELPWCPVVQGYGPDDYFRCVDLYASAGFDLTREPIVGVGSICRRQATSEAASILADLARMGLRIHGFGLKLLGLGQAGPHLESSDSLAWSSHARRRPPLPGCEHKSCANCLIYATAWRDRVMRMVDRPTQARMSFA